jgi:hypothetical protein
MFLSATIQIAVHRATEFSNRSATGSTLLELEAVYSFSSSHVSQAIQFEFNSHVGRGVFVSCPTCNSDTNVHS